MKDITFKNVFDHLAPQRDEFCVRYYRWSRQDAEREIEENFRLLRKIKSSLAYSAVEFCEDLRKDDRRRWLLGRVKKGHPRGVELTGERATNGERELDEKHRVFTAERLARRRLKIANTAFRKFLRKKLGDRDLGVFDPWDLPREWRYRKKLGEWTVETYVEVSGGFSQLAYKHLLKAFDEIPIGEEAGISCMAWLGLAPTFWDDLTNEDLPEAAEDILSLSRHFLDALPDLVEGISLPMR